jgi:hypothetical protein
MAPGRKGRGPEKTPALPAGTPAGWYADPLGVAGARYWDGAAWSDTIRDSPGPEPLPPPAASAPAEGTATQPFSPAPPPRRPTRSRAWMERWRALPKGVRIAVVALALLVIVAAASGGGSKPSSSTAASSAASASGESRVEPPVALHLNQGSFSVSAPGAAISGTVTRGASVTVNGRSVAVHDGHWRDPLGLHIGQNTVAVVATMTGHSQAERTIEVLRHHDTAELEALARQHAQHEEENQRHGAEERERIQRLKSESESKSTPEQSRPEENSPEEGSSGSGECPNGTYENSNGNTICKPYTPENGEQPAGATAECEDGTYSFSEHRSGTCSDHGGVKRWLNE